MRMLPSIWVEFSAIGVSWWIEFWSVVGYYWVDWWSVEKNRGKSEKVEFIYGFVKNIKFSCSNIKLNLDCKIKHHLKGC